MNECEEGRGEWEGMGVGKKVRKRIEEGMCLREGMKGLRRAGKLGDGRLGAIERLEWI